MANNIDFSVSTNAVTVLNQTADAAENTAKGFTSAKAELRALNNQLLTMDQTSDAFKKASARAAELKDNISDLSAEISANAGNAFEGLSNNVGLFGSRLMNLDLKGAGQALTGMGAAVSKIDFKTLKEEVGGLTKGLFDLGKAVLANPFFLAGAALAAIVVYWDEINDAIKGTTTSINQLNEANAKLESQNKVLEHRIEIEKIINGNSEKAYQLTVDKLGKDIEIAQNELEVKKLSGDINGVREAENKLLVLRNQLNGINVQHEVDRAKIVENAYKIAYENWGKEHDAQKTANVYDQERVLRADERRRLEEQIKVIQKEQEQQSKNNIGLLGVESVDNQIKIKQNNEILTLQYQIKKLKQDENALAAASKKIIDESLKSEDSKKEKTEKTREVLGQVYNLELEYNLLLVDEEKIKQDKLTAIWMEGHKTRSVISEEYRKQLIEADRQVYEARWALASASVDLLGTIFQKNKKAANIAFALDKGLAIAKVVVDTQAEIAGYYAANAAAGPVGMAVASTQALAAKIRAATSIATIAAASVAKFSGGGGGSASLGGGGGGSVTGGTTAPSPANYDFISQQPNQQPPLQAYVLGGQVSSNLEAQQLIQNQSRLGG
jgi:uncharacterized membrane protein YgcG